MIDQSFSVANFETVFNEENRRGAIDLDFMSDSYQDIVKRMKDMRSRINEIERKAKLGRTDEESEELEALIKDYKILQERKHDALIDELSIVEDKINGHDFAFSFSSTIVDGKEIFYLDKASKAEFYASKQLQCNIKKTFKVKQADRHSISSNIKTVLSTRQGLYVIRTDVSSFFESIPQDRLLSMIMPDNILSSKSKSLILRILEEYEGKKNKALVAAGKGIPRGIGISAYLSEIYMRKIDKAIKERAEVLFYSRYVDDIFIVLTNLPGGKTLEKYYEGLVSDFQKSGLTLKPIGDPDGKCILLELIDETAPTDITYLGYKMSISRNESGNEVVFHLSDKKIERIRARINNVFTHFENKSRIKVKEAAKDMLDALHMLAGNVKLNKSKAGVKAGIFYSNDLLDGDKIEDLSSLTDYLHSKDIILASPIFTEPQAEEFKMHLKRKIDSIDFRQGWSKRNIYDIPVSQMNEIKKWLNAGVR